MTTFQIRGLTAHQFASQVERDAFLKSVVLDDDGLPVPATDYAKLAGSIGGTLADTKLTAMVIQAMIGGARARDESDAAAAAAGSVVVVPNRNCKGFSVFQGAAGSRRHLVWVADGTLQRIHNLSADIDKLQAGSPVAESGATIIDGAPHWYYSSIPEYVIQRGKRKGDTAPAKPAVVVSVPKGSLNVKAVAKGAAADDFAQKHKMTQFNNPAMTEDDDDSA